MQYFDLHCDTLYKAATDNSELNNHTYEVSFSNTDIFSKWCQCFAIWIPDNLSAQEGMKLFLKSTALMHEHSKTLNLHPFNPDENTTQQFIITLENCSILSGNPANIDLISEQKVKMATLTWNDENCVGGGADVQSKGLTDFGKHCVREFENRGIIIDVSHASDRTFNDVMANTTSPVAASHSNSRSVCSHRRNLTDEQFVEITRRKGVVGLNFHKDFLNDNRDKASITDVIKHTEHFLSLGGEDTLCIGSDFDGADPISELSSNLKIPYLYESFLKAGYNEQLVQKILYYNAYNFFSRF